MTERLDSEVEIYIGSPVEYESERLVLRTVVTTLSKAATPAVILANVTLSSRQIDLIVATQQSVLLIEAKSSSRPIRGRENGLWAFQSATGEWRNVGRNWYQQALDAKHALRDAMKKFSSEETPYPAGALIFAPFIPQGSDVLPGDFKVMVGDLAILQDLGVLEKKSNWSLEQWRNFAGSCRLTKVGALDMAFDESLVQSATMLEEYRSAFTSFYGPRALDFVPFSCAIGESDTDTKNLETRVAERGDLLVVGPSGCGKSMLAKLIGVKCAAAGHIPILVEAIHFAGSFEDLLNQEAALLNAPSISALFSASRRCGAPIVVILDGFNECPQSLRDRLARCLRAIALRSRVSLLITSQAEFHELQILNLDVARVPEPGIELKKQIASIEEGLIDSEKAELLLSLAKSGLEARIVGRVIKQVGSEISRYGLFDCYIRELLADQAREGIAILSSVARYLSDCISFRMSVRDFERLMAANNWSQGVAESLFKTRIITTRKENLVFGHEQYLAAFSSEAVVRAAGMSAESILSAMRAPRHSAYATLILGAIDDTHLLEQVLAGVMDSSLIVACATGQCGIYAEEWVALRCNKIFQLLEEEASSVRFEIDDRGWLSMLPVPETLLNWSPHDLAFVDALPELLLLGQYLEKVFFIAGVTDARLTEETVRLKAEASRRKVALGSGLFGACFGNQNSDVAIGRIISRIGLSLSHKNDDKSKDIEAWVQNMVTSFPLSDGQIQMLLALCRNCWDGSPIIEVLPGWISERWRFAPYHLRLNLLTAAEYCWNCTDEQKAALIASIESLETNNIFLSTSIIDALKSLGAIDGGDYLETVRNEIDEALSDPTNPDNWAKARSIYDRQIDHPYEDAYCEVVNGLDDERRKQLLTLAVRHKDGYRMFVSSMISELAAYHDDANGNDIERWTELPPKDNPFQQDAVGAFVIAHISLGKFGYEIRPKAYDQSDEDNAMLACGEIYYWMSRDEISVEERDHCCKPALRILLKHEAGASLPALRSCEDALRSNIYAAANRKEVSRSIVANFPSEVAEICRAALINKYPQHERGASIHGEPLGYAAHLLGYCGSHTDLNLLRSLVDDDQIGETAVAAVQCLEERLTG